mmetsp:Transcript_5060/g.22614  ORF Transcript_5060/g.22614 Transcript_5060/m.22614 type:complete len:264 (+) Transcript_5060:146-937(+)
MYQPRATLPCTYPTLSEGDSDITAPGYTYDPSPPPAAPAVPTACHHRRSFAALSTSASPAMHRRTFDAHTLRANFSVSCSRRYRSLIISIPLPSVAYVLAQSPSAKTLGKPSTRPVGPVLTKPFASSEALSEPPPRKLVLGSIPAHMNTTSHSCRLASRTEPRSPATTVTFGRDANDCCNAAFTGLGMPAPISYLFVTSLMGTRGYAAPSSAASSMPVGPAPTTMTPLAPATRAASSLSSLTRSFPLMLVWLDLSRLASLPSA